MNRTTEIYLPTPVSSQNTPNPLTVEGSSLVILGANGSGKTRLGTWLELESTLKKKVHRIAAQKSLSVPKFISTSSSEHALDSLKYGIDVPTIIHMIDNNQYSSLQLEHNKKNTRWQNNPYTGLLDDFRYLLNALFSDSYEVNSKYVEDSKNSNSRIDPPETKLMKAKRIWEKVMPHREIDISSTNLKTQIPNSPNSYEAGAMSDGERAAFYLIGQCIVASEESIIVIDEPELHIHRSIQGPLFDAIELERPDCLFVYITHDLDFAASRIGATRVWLKGYDGNNWEWELVPEQEGVPEQLLLNVIGSRKKILLVEGDRSSLDYAIYSSIYPDRTIYPIGGCANVLAAVRTLRSLETIHHLDPLGLIDRDYRENEEIESLSKKGVKVLRLHELEQLFLLEPIITEVAFSLGRDDAEIVIEAIRSKVFECAKKDVKVAAAKLAANRIRKRLASFETKDIKDDGSLNQRFALFIEGVSSQEFYNQAEEDIQDALNNENYSALLQLYPNKGLPCEVGVMIGLPGKNYIEHVKRLIKSPLGGNLIKAIRSELPDLDMRREIETPILIR